MRINRLLEITMILLNKELVTARELAERFQVSTRTIYRDVDALSAAGVPVYMKQGTGGGIALLPEYSLSKTLFSAEDREGLLLAVQTLQVTKMPEVDAALQRLGTLFGEGEMEEWAQVDFTPWGSHPNEAGKFTTIKRAIISRQVLRFEYVNSAGETSWRTAEPLKLAYKGQAWYLYANCRLRNEYRLFRLSRVKGLTLLDEQFPKKEFVEIPDMEGNSSRPRMVTLSLKFQPNLAYRVYDDFAESQIERVDDGTLQVTVTFPEDEWVYGYILSFGPAVEVLAPAHVRVIVGNRLREACKIYNSVQI
ncbi:MAG: YafY family transcriptional regulator [Firmicutes bacterium]|nr:YafY family transcriptional regulator [Bacillota bacterium]